MSARSWAGYGIAVVGVALGLVLALKVLERQYTIRVPYPDFLLKEEATIRVMMKGDTCVVAGLPDEIVTKWGRKVTWKIAGECADGFKVSVEDFELQAGEQDPTSGKKETDAKPGEITATVKAKSDAPEGLYIYRILVKGPKPGGDPWGKFALCPEWPCRGK